MMDSEESQALRASAEFQERLERLDRQASAAPTGCLDHRVSLDLRASRGLPGAMVPRASPELSGRTVQLAAEGRRVIVATLARKEILALPAPVLQALRGR